MVEFNENDELEDDLEEDDEGEDDEEEDGGRRPATTARRPDRSERSDRSERPERRPQRGRPQRRPRFCHFCVNKVTYIDYKDVDTLRRFVTDRGRIRPRRQTGTCAKHQRGLSTAIKRARHLALVPFTGDLSRGG